MILTIVILITTIITTPVILQNNHKHNKFNTNKKKAKLRDVRNNNTIQEKGQIVCRFNEKYCFENEKGPHALKRTIKPFMA